MLNTHRSGVLGLFEDLSRRLDVLWLLAAFEDTHLLLHPHTQTLHHLRTRRSKTCVRLEANTTCSTMTQNEPQTHTCSAVLVTRPWFSLSACFWEKRWVWLFLSRARWICHKRHTHTHTNRQGGRGVGITVYKAQCAGEGRQVHLHGNEETGERILRSTERAGWLYILESAGGRVYCLNNLSQESRSMNCFLRGLTFTQTPTMHTHTHSVYRFNSVCNHQLYFLIQCISFTMNTSDIPANKNMFVS